MSHTPLYTPFKLFTPKTCKKIIKQAQLQHTKMRGWTVGGIHSIRTNSVYFIHQDCTTPELEVYELVKKHLTARPDLPMDWIQEHWQVSQYEPGQFYDWHTDSVAKWDGRSSQRSITLTATLQAAKGAVIETKQQAWDLPVGWAVLFRADDVHKASPPIEGTRWSFTAWGMKWNPDIIPDVDTEPRS